MLHLQLVMKFSVPVNQSMISFQIPFQDIIILGQFFLETYYDIETFKQEF